MSIRRCLAIGKRRMPRHWAPADAWSSGNCPCLVIGQLPRLGHRAPAEAWSAGACRFLAIKHPSMPDHWEAGNLRSAGKTPMQFCFFISLSRKQSTRTSCYGDTNAVTRSLDLYGQYVAGVTVKLTIVPNIFSRPVNARYTICFWQGFSESGANFSLGS